MERKFKEQPKNSIDGTEYTVRRADNRSLHRKLIVKPINFQKSPKRDMSPNKHDLREPSGKYVSASKIHKPG